LATTAATFAVPPAAQAQALCTPRTVIVKPPPRPPGAPPTTTVSAAPGASLAVAVNCGDVAATSALPPASAASAASSAVAPAAPSSAESTAALKAATAAQEFRTALLQKVAYATAALAVCALAVLVWAMFQARREGLRVISYWGGFGGSGTGWHLTPAAVGLLATALLVLATLGLVMALLQASRPEAPNPATPKSAAPPAA
jgi:hypothetical protein